MTRRYYAVLTRTDMPIIPYHVHAFDSAARRDAWCAGPVPRGFDAQPATAHAALRDLRSDMRLDDAWGATVDQYPERHPERWHDGAHGGHDGRRGRGPSRLVALVRGEPLGARDVGRVHAFG